MPQMGKTEEDWNGLNLGFLKTVQSNSFSKLISAVCNFKKKKKCSGNIFVCLESLILSFPCKFFVYFKFHSDWGWVIDKIKQNELDCRDTAPLTFSPATLTEWCLGLFTMQVARDSRGVTKIEQSSIPWILKIFEMLLSAISIGI